MKRVFPTVLTLLVVIAAAVVFLAREGVAELIYRETVSSGSESLFLGAHDTAELETVAVVYKTVFPHDYFVEGVNFYALLDRVRRSDAPAADVLTPAELDHFEAVNLAQSLGLATTPGQPGYVVVTSTLRYGYDLSRLESHIRDGIEASVIPIPPAELLSQETEDLTTEEYPYSPVYLDAEGWQTVAGFVAERQRRSTPDGEIISQASMIGIELLETLTDRKFRVVDPAEG